MFTSSFVERFAPWQLITSALSLAYVLSNLDRVLGLDGYYRLVLLTRTMLTSNRRPLVTDRD